MRLTACLDGLRARFDARVLCPPAPVVQADARATAAELLARQPAARAGLQAWCWQGAGPGNAAWSRPGAQPAVGLRLAAAALHVAGDFPDKPPGEGPRPSLATAWADAFATELDGSQRLAALPGPAAGLALRLGVKMADAMWWRARQPADPWDAGWAIATPSARTHWQTAFMPRRATLILADGCEAEALSSVLAALAARSEHFRHPVRWLWVGGGGEGAGSTQGLALMRFELG